jgi:hypothetical protein
VDDGENNITALLQLISMRRCENCLVAEAKPGVEFDNENICPACRRAQHRQHINYDERFDQLEEIAEEHRRDDGYYDCIIPVSGGKTATINPYHD